jgi:ATP-dependent DNA ligase
MDKIVIARGIAMPFYPMRPAQGRVLRNQGNVNDFNRQELKQHDWVIQPKLEGDRACIGVLDGAVYIQNRHGDWYKQRVNNLADFKKLPSGTVLDGEVFKGNFYAFDCLASGGKSHLMATAAEREVLAFQMTKYLKHEWKFERPSKAWVSKLHAQMPVYGGVVLKRMNSEYVIMGSPNQASLNWLKRTWG